MTRLLTLLLTVALLAPATTNAHRGCHSDRCRERVARKQCSQKRVVPCIRRAALHRGQDFQAMLRVARCESGLNPYARNSEHSGLFQFRTAAPSTWATTPYARRDPFSAKWNSLAAAWAWQQGRKNEWACV